MITGKDRITAQTVRSFSVVNFFVVGLFRFFERIAVPIYQQVISSGLHGLLQCLGRTVLGIIFYGCRCRSVVYGCYLDTGLPVQRLFYPCGT